MFTRLEIEVIAGVILAIAACIGLYFYDAHEKAMGKAEFVVGVQRAVEKQQAQDAEKLAATEAAQAVNLHEAIAQNAARAMDDRYAGAIVQRLRNDTVRRPAAASSAVITAGSQAGKLPGTSMVPWSLYQASLNALADTEQDLVDVSAYADCLRTSGQLCVNDEKALKP